MIKLRIKEYREQKNLSYRQLEILSGVSKTMIFNIETGRRSPTIDILEKLAKGLKVSIHDLIEEI
ncbi:MAG: helix-turn-helix transcriptional regulator [Lachnospiraceae bacterium]|nr:helix-turn-helix transcriptional regulator [Lachnospiraceae bacterium]